MSEIHFLVGISPLHGHGTSCRLLRWLKSVSAASMLFTTMAMSSSAQTLSTLVNFGFSNGEGPYGTLVQGRDGNFYGTTLFGGTGCSPNGCGSIFQVTPAGTLATLHTFCAETNCADGYNPDAGLVLGTDGNFYGTTSGGGAHSGGTIFTISPQGNMTVLYDFCSQTNCADGNGPTAGTLIQATNGEFYGTTSAGGAHNSGTVFKVTLRGTHSTLYSFCARNSCEDGINPMGGLVRGMDSNLYGTTYAGGALAGYGTVFKISPGGKLTTLHSFHLTDGENPIAPLIQASNGVFYGSTFLGGSTGLLCSFGCGTTFKMTADGKLSTLNRLNWSNGAQPYAGLVQGTDGNLYGTTADGLGAGTIFRVAPGSGLTTLYGFYFGPTGEFPYAGVVQGTSGTFYGTTVGDGVLSFGTVYSLNVGLGPFVALVQPTGKVGQSAQVLGQGFNGTTSVTFNGVPASNFTIVSDTYLTAVVPKGATTGNVVVTTPAGTLTSNVKFQVGK